MFLISIKSTLSEAQWVGEALPLIGSICSPSGCKQVVHINECIVSSKPGMNYFEIYLPREGTFEYRFEDSQDTPLAIILCFAHKFGKDFVVEITSDHETPEEAIEAMEGPRKELLEQNIQPNYDLQGALKMFLTLQDILGKAEDDEDEGIIIF